ncbi:hypothetical protein ONS95_012170 [Cadophora gregata]|uniref:uncharacterized protein n=1 Tax=Cadophora gregata TaxID=51156 RepID=UPI0026DBB30C|nr:uncharacterized protein ONS95_012170 [Cadophora gregata]KAK0117849.1 hypothetical protein ONS95_012170 [Cadophora gregata]KAK0122904.1 hypothetical protein ONS96_009929 [Cadophora gregata f. sp. sojae]
MTEYSEKEQEQQQTTTGVCEDTETVLYGPPLPPFDKASSTRLLCTVGVVVSWVLSILCLGVGGYAIAVNGTRAGSTFLLNEWSSAQKVIIPLLLNIVVSFCTDCLGYVHSASLRWAMYREGRLAFNSNLRLLTGSKAAGPNRWYSNLLGSAGLVLCYASTSQVFIAVTSWSFYGDETHYQYFTFVNGVALTCLGAGLLVQTIISTACLISQSKHILTWSSNPLNATLAYLHHDLRRRDGRSLMPASDRNLPPTPRTPQEHQPSVARTESSVKKIEYLVWFLVVLAGAWACIILGVCKHV